MKFCEQISVSLCSYIQCSNFWLGKSGDYHFLSQFVEAMILATGKKIGYKKNDSSVKFLIAMITVCSFCTLFYISVMYLCLVYERILLQQGINALYLIVKVWQTNKQIKSFPVTRLH